MNMRAVEVAADLKLRLLHRLDSSLAILLAVSVENLDVDLVAKDLSRNRILFVAVNATPLRVRAASTSTAYS